MSKIDVILGDITKCEVDAIVNAANSRLVGGGGVDGAIHRAGGPEIMKECDAIREKQGGCPTGEAVVTTAGKLPAKYVIHTVGPVWSGGDKNEKELLHNAYENSLKEAMKLDDVQSIAFPNISTGVYGFPKEKAAEIAISSVRSFIDRNKYAPDVTFVCFGEDNKQIYDKLLNEE